MLLQSGWIQLALVVFTLCLVQAADHYSTLGLKKSASEADIKKAYKKLSRKYHPDKNSSPDAEELFIAISTAYEVLSDTETRSIYDRYGAEGLKQHEAQKQGGGMHHNPFDMFSQFFGGQRQQEKRGPSMLTTIEVDLADMYKGKHIEFTMPRQILCDHCRGSGAMTDGDIKQCGTCGGRGVTVQRAQVFPGMYTNVQATCNTCAGKGKVIHRACPHCKGAKTMTHQNRLDVDIPPGAPEGWETILEGEADESPDYEAGDVVLRVRSKQSVGEAGGWRRKDAGLYRREILSVDEALLGFERNITHLDGHVVSVKRPGTTQPGYVEVFKGEGMPANGPLPQGDLYVEYTVVLPSAISDKAREGLESVFAASRDRTRDEL
ncbi:hypothetical protein NliqN6_1283 [Naganishia liquefaciens]|uniref:DnaJ-domain-containing protein n=1 Tax=Naganishia liquefaciens TaxID=104408 RepID=A0A8H3YEL8_9TREE|nr:hypothetical protein NliqN6_1283 [Naganishia liquefaciens]